MNNSKLFLNNYFIILWFIWLIILFAPIPFYVPIIFYADLFLSGIFLIISCIISLTYITLLFIKLFKKFSFNSLLKYLTGSILLVIINFSLLLYSYFELSYRYIDLGYSLIPKLDQIYHINDDKFYVFQKGCNFLFNDCPTSDNAFIAIKVKYLPFIKPVEFLNKTIIDIKLIDNHVVATFEDNEQTILVYK